MMTGRSIPVVAFHHVSPDIQYYTNRRMESFRRYIGELSRKYSLVTVAEARRHLAEGLDCDGLLVITFDDAYEDNYRYAHPILEEFGAKATFFVISGYVGMTNSWNRKATYQSSHMSWDQLDDLLDAGHEIASHGVSHRNMTLLEPSELESELAVSKQTLEERLGTAVTAFSYPYGLCDAAVQRQCAKYYDIAFSTVKSRRTDWISSRYELRREYLPAEDTGAPLDQMLNEWYCNDLDCNSNPQQV